jgi:uncharacterized protein (TIGR02757 family)
MFKLFGPSPYAFIMEGNFRKFGSGNIHRTFFEKDLAYFCQGFRECFKRYGTLENLFSNNELRGHINSSVWAGIERFRETMAAGNRGLYTKHIANPAANSACKRINLALRWLVRREGPVDMGLWKGLSPASLYIPLDLHVGRTARALGLLDPARKANDKRAVVELTEKLRGFCPDDPIKYDLALFGAEI